LSVCNLFIGLKKLARIQSQHFIPSNVGYREDVLRRMSRENGLGSERMASRVT
jgi:hypothetical protein